MEKYCSAGQDTDGNMVHAHCLLDKEKWAKGTRSEYFDVLLTVHLSVTLVNDQLDAQFFYFIIRLLQSSTRFEQRRAHHQEIKLY